MSLKKETLQTKRTIIIEKMFPCMYYKNSQVVQITVRSAFVIFLQTLYYKSGPRNKKIDNASYFLLTIAVKKEKTYDPLYKLIGHLKEGESRGRKGRKRERFAASLHRTYIHTHSIYTYYRIKWKISRRGGSNGWWRGWIWRRRGWL